ncbi:VirB4 family type IV secretion system protein [Brucella intermedia]|uniref:VirB4 family type IV secretion system protein n=1 Tax=Brucella intermedia TaxID=94625 RepID=UPI00235FFC21|nr:type IV secretion system protein B4 [Brucella intermedia]
MSHKLDKKSPAFKAFARSSGGAKVFPAALFREQQFEDYLPYAFLIGDDRTIQTKDRKLLQCLRLGGLNSATASDEKIDQLKNLLAKIIGNNDDSFSYYVHKISKPINYDPDTITGNEFAAEIDGKWVDYLHNSAFRDVTITVTVISSPSILLKVGGAIEKLRQWRDGNGSNARYEAYRADITERVVRLNELTGLMLSAFADIQARILTASSGELLGFLESIGCGTETKAFPLDEYAVLSRSIANYRPTLRGTTLHISGGSVSNRIGRIFTIKSYPRHAFAGIFDGLKLPLDVVITNSFTPIPDQAAKELLRRVLAQRSSINDAAQTDLEQMREGRNKIASGLERLGYHHMTVAIYADDMQILDKASAEIRAVAQEAGAKVITEAFAGKGHYFAQWPGNEEFRSRTGLISNYAFAGIASLHRTPTGLDGDSVVWGAPLTAFPTLDGGLYKLNFHPRSRPGAEPPAAHAAMFGDMGSGKTVLVDFITAQARRQNVRTFIFDYRRGTENAVKALKGAFTTIAPDTPTGLNPLYAETDAEGRAWLTDWLIALLDRDDHKFSAAQRQAITDAINMNADAPDKLRNFSAFVELFSHVDDDGDLQQRIKEWAGDGRFGWVFGNNPVEEFALNNPVMAFDMTNLIDSGHEKEKTAILGYLFRQIEKKLRDKKPSLIIVDEAWSALNTEYFAKKLGDWLVTARKLNAVVVLCTQFPSQITSSRLGGGMLQAIRTHIVLPNRNAKPVNYESIDLNERELNTILQSPPGLRLALIRNETESVAVNINLSALGEHLTIMGGGPSGEAAFAEYIARKSHD